MTMKIGTQVDLLMEAIEQSRDGALAKAAIAEGHTRQAQARAGPRTLATAEGVCAAASCSPKAPARLGEPGTDANSSR